MLAIDQLKCTYLMVTVAKDCCAVARENFMGSGGDIAEEFAALIKALWSEQYRSIAPRDFKVRFKLIGWLLVMLDCDWL